MAVRLLIALLISITHLNNVLTQTHTNKNTVSYATPIHKKINSTKAKALAKAVEESNLIESKQAYNTTNEITSEQKRRILALVSIFENDTIEPQYSYIENLQDGRGYTCGIGGFITANNEVYTVVKLYTETVPENKLSKYLDILKELAEKGSDDTKKLSDFAEAWQESAKDPRFREAQNEYVDKNYFIPAMTISQNLGLEYALSKGVVYDTLIQHGNGNDPDSLKSIISKTNNTIGGAPVDGVDEIVWLNTFLTIRKDTLTNPNNKSTKDVWRASTDRVEVFLTLVQQGNLSFVGPIQINSKNHYALIP